jgi:hypothetical protein
LPGFGFVSNLIVLTQEQCQARLPIWQALSELFLDTELQPYQYAYIARTIREQSLSVQEAEAILWQEIFPVMATNLIQVAGEWAGWTDQWFLKNMPAHLEKSRQPLNQLFFWLPKKLVRKEIEREWQTVLVYFNDPTKGVVNV